MAKITQKTRNTIFNEAKALQKELIEIRRRIHGYAEIGFDLPQTKAFVKEKLTQIGCQPIDCGKAGIIADIGRSEDKKAFLLRADMDALPIKEETGLFFAAKNGNMHACGHDMHTAMLLGAAKIIKEHEGELKQRVRLMFQPAEEKLQGARDMIESGVLHRPPVKGAMMLHVLTGTPLPSGTVVVSSKGVTAPAADYFTVTVQGKGCHGSMPQEGIDALNALAHIYIALQEIPARELSISQPAVLTVGQLQAGAAANVLPDSAVMQGTLRTYDERTRSRLKKRIVEIARAVAIAFRAKANVTFDSGCPTLKNDEKISRLAYTAIRAILQKSDGESSNESGDEAGDVTHNITVFTSEQLNDGKRVSGGGSEDFAYVSHKVPSVMVALAAGGEKEGCGYPLHHPKTRFDENVLYIGSAIYAAMAFGKNL